MEKSLLSQVTPTVSYTLSVVERGNGKFPTLQLHVYTPSTRNGWEAQAIGLVRRPMESVPWGENKSLWKYNFDGDRLSLMERSALDLIWRMECSLAARKESYVRSLEQYYDLDDCQVLGRSSVQLEDIWKK